MAVRRGVALVLVLVGVAVLVSVAGSVFLYLLLSREPTVPDRATLVLRLGGELQEVPPEALVGQLFERDATDLRGLVETIRMAKRDARVASLLIVPTGLELPYWGKVQELRDALLDFRTSGKPIVAFLEYGGDREYYLASAADRVFLLPTSPLDLTGVASYQVFLRGAFDKIGAYPDFLHIGDYKTAPNQLTEKSLTPAHREMVESLNRDMYEQLVRGIATARKKTDGEVRALLDRGPFPPDEALRSGLVDDLAYFDQLDDRVPALSADGKPTPRIDGSAYRRISPRSVGIHPRSRIAVLYAVGMIASGKSRFDPTNGAIVGSDTLTEQIRRIRDDESIKAIVVRIDSPGGSSVASDVIWRELMITRDQKPSRPLITSMSDLAASGGYYIALPGQVIVAQPATLTGSIGIFAGKIVLGGTMEKLGVTEETVQSGRNADIYSPFTRFSAGQRARILEFMKAFYDSFVEKAAESRHTTPEQIDAVGQGRVWTGQQARQQGLVDALGGLDTAVSIAKERAKIAADEDVELVVFPPRRSIYETLAEQLGRSRMALWGMWAGFPDARGLAPAMGPVQLFRRGEPLALMPVGFLRD